MGNTNESQRREQRPEPRYMSQLEVARLQRDRRTINNEQIQDTVNVNTARRAERNNGSSTLERKASTVQVDDPSLLQQQKKPNQDNDKGKKYQEQIPETQQQNSISKDMSVTQADIEKFLKAQKQYYETRLNELTRSSVAPSAPPSASTDSGDRTETKISQYRYDRDTLIQLQKSNPSLQNNPCYPSHIENTRDVTGIPPQTREQNPTPSTFRQGANNNPDQSLQNNTFYPSPIQNSHDVTGLPPQTRYQNPTPSTFRQGVNNNPVASLHNNPFYPSPIQNTHDVTGLPPQTRYQNPTPSTFRQGVNNNPVASLHNNPFYPSPIQNIHDVTGLPPQTRYQNPTPSTSRQVENNNLVPSTSSQSLASNKASEDSLFVKNKNKKGQANASNKNIQRTAQRDLSQSNVRNRSQSRSRQTTNKNEGNGEEIVNCSTCNNRFGLQIFQCNAGHSSCNTCKNAARACGTCNGQITDMRNIALQDYVAQVKVPCKNKDIGCVLYLKMIDMEIHDAQCPFNDLTCPLSKNCGWKGKLSQLRQHFEICHPINCTGGVDKEMYLVNLRSQNKNLHLITLGTYHFLVHTELDGQAFKMTVQLIGTRNGAKKWCYEIHVYNKADPQRKYLYSDICNSHIDKVDEIFRDAQSVNVPLSYLETFVNPQGYVNYKVFLKKGNDIGRKNNNNNKYGGGKGKRDVNENLSQ